MWNWKLLWMMDSAKDKRHENWWMLMCMLPRKKHNSQCDAFASLRLARSKSRNLREHFRDTHCEARRKLWHFPRVVNFLLRERREIKSLIKRNISKICNLFSFRFFLAAVCVECLFEYLSYKRFHVSASRNWLFLSLSFVFLFFRGFRAVNKVLKRHDGN